MPMTKLKAEPNAKLRFLKALSSTIGSAAVNARQKNTTPPTSAARGKRRDVDPEPIVTGALLEHVFERSEKDRHCGQPDIVEPIDQAVVRLVEVDQQKDSNRDKMSGSDVD